MIEIFLVRIYSAVDFGVGQGFPEGQGSPTPDDYWYVFSRSPSESWKQWRGPFQTREMAVSQIDRFDQQDVKEFGMVEVQV